MGNIESSHSSDSNSGNSYHRGTSNGNHSTVHSAVISTITTDTGKNNVTPNSYVEFFTYAGKTISNASGIVCGAIEDTFEGEDKYATGKKTRGNGRHAAGSGGSGGRVDVGVRASRGRR